MVLCLVFNGLTHTIKCNYNTKHSTAAMMAIHYSKITFSSTLRAASVKAIPCVLLALVNVLQAFQLIISRL